MRLPNLRRVVAALVLAVVLAALIARQTNIVIMSPCELLDPVSNPWLWWLNRCGDPAGGGGGGGAT